MKRSAQIALATLVILMGSVPATEAQSLLNQKREIEFRSGPMQPPEIESYLQQMRKIVDQYNGVVFQLVQGAASGAPPNAQTMGAASAHTQQLAQQIRSLKAPQEIFSEHKRLAQTLGEVEGFLQSGGGPAAMPQALALMANVQGTMSSYRNSTNGLIRRYGLSPSLDPFGGESADKKQQASGIMDAMKGNLTNGMFGGGGTDGSFGSTGGSAGSFGGTGSPFGGSGSSFGGLGNMLGGSGGGGGGMDMGGLGQLFGQLGGGTAGGGLGDLGKMFGGSSGGSSGSGGFGSGGFGSTGGFGSSGSFGSGGSFGGSQGLTGTPSSEGGGPEDIMKQLGDQQKTIEGLLGE
jgi:hypothetical protein